MQFTQGGSNTSVICQSGSMISNWPINLHNTTSLIVVHMASLNIIGVCLPSEYDLYMVRVFYERLLFQDFKIKEQH